MNAHRPRRLDRGTAERLLSGAVVDPQDGPEVLVRLLAATRATPHAGELVDETAAMDAYRAAHLGLILQPRRPSMLETALAKLLTLKVGAAAAATVVATGGVALAAANGSLPNPLSSDAPKAKPSAHATDKPDATDKASAEAGDKGAGSPSPSMVGLCRAYKAGAGDNPGKALENPAFSVLITTAGDKEKVAAYCDALLAAQKGKSTPPAGGATTRPGKAPATPPTGKPNNHPTGKPDSHTSGAPVTRITPPPAAGASN